MSRQGHDGDADDKRRRILEAALRVCEAHGVHAARMEEVAALAQVSKGTLYRFFESKEDLFLATIIDSYEQALRAAGAPVPGAGQGPADPGERLTQLFARLTRVLEAVTPRVRVHYQAWGVVGDSPEAAARLDEFLGRFHRERQLEWEQIVRDGQRAGVFRADVEPATVAHMIGALLSGFLYRAAFDPASATPEALRLCFDSVLRETLAHRPGAVPAEVDRDD